MPNLFHGAFRANVIALSALTLSAAFALPAPSAYAASTKKPTHRSEALRARASTPETIACTTHGCEVVPVGCRAVAQPGQTPGYQMITCP
ncbi:hypothetical protein [Undibacter mobilis]|uniref:Uncharacterized protein n=1 Tax=Undibacter mobilis TaxID=2292256 RepID=A0A371BD93_9BRAD|nr:hypothetical protein [Undibacter mobilis]RDV05518.1 hypothetical protein DXH78_13615 [Undibacter mobilis]